MIPIEIQDKIFLYLSFEDLEKSRELQSPYVKDRTKFGTLIDVIKYINAKYNGLNNIKWLLNQGIDPSANDNRAIRSASSNGHTDAVKLLLADPRVDPAADNNEAIRAASRHGHAEIVKILLDDPRVDPSANNNDAIRVASENGHTEIVKLLLDDPRVDPSAYNNESIRWA